MGRHAIVNIYTLPILRQINEKVKLFLYYFPLLSLSLNKKMDKGQDNRDMTELYQGWVGDPADNTIIFSEIM